jgi:hypothetical protein
VPVRKKSGGPRRRSRSSAPEHPRNPYTALASEPPHAFPRPRASPRPRAHQGPWSPRTPRGALDLAAILHCLARRSVAASPARARRPSELAVLRSNGRHDARRRLEGAAIPHRLFKRHPSLLAGSTPPPRRHGRRRAELSRPSLLRSSDCSSVMPRSYRSSKARVLPRIPGNLAGMLAAAVATGPLRRPRSPPAFRPPIPARIDPR